MKLIPRDPDELKRLIAARETEQEIRARFLEVMKVMQSSDRAAFTCLEVTPDERDVLNDISAVVVREDGSAYFYGLPVKVVEP
jgi:hypothetical protein